MTKPSSLPTPLSAARVRELTARIRQHANHIRVYLYEVYANDGWRVLGYTSWRAYLVGEFSDMSYSYLTRQTKAALLEARAGDSVGTHKEAHLRAITESSLTDEEKLVAYRNLGNDIDAADVREITAKVRVRGSCYQITKEYMDAGTISATTALSIVEMLDEIGEESTRKTCELVTDIEMIPILVRMASTNSDTWQEIRLSHTIPAFPDPIPIHKATAANLLAWLDVSSAEHRAVAAEKRRAFFARLNSATDAIVDEMYALAGGEKFNQDKIKSLVAAHKQAVASKEDSSGFIKGI